jgi:hypothetical protein
MGGNLGMVTLGVPLGEDDILQNHNDIEIMEKSNKSIPFKGG